MGSHDSAIRYLVAELLDHPVICKFIVVYVNIK